MKVGDKLKYIGYQNNGKNYTNVFGDIVFEVDKYYEILWINKSKIVGVSNEIEERSFTKPFIEERFDMKPLYREMKMKTIL